MVSSRRREEVSIPWLRDRATGLLVADSDDTALYYPPAELIRYGAEPPVLLGIAQEAVARVLEEIVNHWPDRRILGGHQRQRLTQRLASVHRIMHALDRQGLPISSVPVPPGQDLGSQALACVRAAREVASGLALALDDVIVSFAETRAADSPPDPVEAELESRLVQLASRAGHAVEGLYLQGSIALGETTGFSDFDGIVLLGTSAEQHVEMLRLAAQHTNASAQLLLARDVLQHHGWLVLAPYLLEAFPEDILPLQSLEEAIALSGPDQITVRRLRCQLLARRRLWSMVQVFRQLQLTDWEKDPPGLHGQKMLLSQFMLLPCLYAQATGRYVSKRNSFALVREELPHVPWEIMDEVSELRRRWTQPAWGPFWRGTAVCFGAWEAQAAWRRFSRVNGGAGKASRVPDSWRRRMSDFAECLLATAEALNRESVAT